MAILILNSHSSKDFQFQVTKLLFDYGADLDFQTCWSIDENGHAIVGVGEVKGNAIQLIQFIKEQKLHDKFQISSEHFDNVLKDLGKKVLIEGWELYYLLYLKINVLKKKRNLQGRLSFLKTIIFYN